MQIFATSVLHLGTDRSGRTGDISHNSVNESAAKQGWQVACSQVDVVIIHVEAEREVGTSFLEYLKTQHGRAASSFDVFLIVDPNTGPPSWLNTREILRYGITVVDTEPEFVAPKTLPEGSIEVPLTQNADGDPEFVTLLGSNSSRQTLAEMTRAVRGMRREFPRPIWTLHAGESRPHVGHPETAVIDALNETVVPGDDRVIFSLYWLLQSPKEGKGNAANSTSDANAVRTWLWRLQEDYPVPPSVLIRGETGVGKTALAKRLHEALFPIDHAERPFRELNAGGIRTDQFNDQVFGSAGGAYTDMAPVPGPALLATFGTLFIDEIGDLDIRGQKALLTFLSERTASVRNWGGRSDALFLPMQVIAATNRNLERQVEAGTFLQDLYNRFAYHVEIPPLRDRKNDLVYLVPQLLRDPRTNPPRRDGMGPSVTHVAEDALEELGVRDFRTGNFRELINTLRDAVARAQEQRSAVLLKEHIPEVIPPVLVGEPIELAAEPTDLLEGAQSLTTQADLERLALQYGVPIMRTRGGTLLVAAQGQTFVFSDSGTETRTTALS